MGERIEKSHHAFDPPRSQEYGTQSHHDHRAGYRRYMEKLRPSGKIRSRKYRTKHDRRAEIGFYEYEPAEQDQGPYAWNHGGPDLADAILVACQKIRQEYR